MSTELHIRETQENQDNSSGVKPAPKSSKVPVPFTYIPSDDGIDENLLILLHGLGDTHIPFAKMGRQLKLPQTAVLSMRAPEQIPYLEESAFQWYTSFDHLGQVIQHPNPTPALDLLSKVFDHLIKECTWPAHRIHLFGFAQGGTVASEFGIKFWREQLREQRPSPSLGSSSSPQASLGSIVSISGPLLSWPQFKPTSPTPILMIHRSPPSEAALRRDDLKALKLAYQSITDEQLSANIPGMPASKTEWHPIMRFWSEKLARRKVEGLYEIIRG
ncbi:hypothetical protein AMATHDRAFT_73266 [Amanita thiersii Skay4041]|uniref:Phospholipase/carboxylesterase/thioesterase domain-containing protein n=1 Tax=Amanita thiersii Skay4041 TaxID=703135 RepID=A0A2A9NZD3_9AGAR|nr:hypothetical protein AMATHDRAFT_73266 [Amanita thiersii Skay4041]